MSGSIWWNPGLVDRGVGGDTRNSVEHKAQFCVTSKPPSVSLLFKPLGMTHLWQCYITHNALKAPAAPPGKTDSSFTVNFTISLTTEAHQRPTRCFHGSQPVTAQLKISLWCWACTFGQRSVSQLSRAQRRCVHMRLLYDQQPIMCVVMALLWCCITKHKAQTQQLRTGKKR